MAERSAASRLAARGGDGADAAGVMPGSAGLWSRLLAYVVDSVVLFAFTMVFASVAGLIVFVSSDYGDRNPSDGAFLALVIVLLATMPSWFLVTLVLLRRRGQTVGQYLLGLRVERSDGAEPRLGQLALYLLALHPLGYHPFFAGLWALLAYESIVIVASTAMLFLSLTLVFLCLFAPFAGLVFVVFDNRRRGIHDWLAGLRLVAPEEEE